MSADPNALVETSNKWYPCATVSAITYANESGDICTVQNSITRKNLKRQKLPATTQFPEDFIGCSEKNIPTSVFHVFDWLLREILLCSHYWVHQLLKIAPTIKSCLLFEQFFQSYRSIKLFSWLKLEAILKLTVLSSWSLDSFAQTM